MQNFGKGNANLEVVRVGGLNSWQGLKLNIHFPQSMTKTLVWARHACFILVGNIRVLKTISPKLSWNKSTTDHLFVKIKIENSEIAMFLP